MMDIPDDISEDKFIELSVKGWLAGIPSPHLRDGELVNDHHPVEKMVDMFNKHVAGGRGLSNLHPYHGRLCISIIPRSYDPCTRPFDELEDMPISDMRLETHHRGKKTTIRILTPAVRSADMIVAAVAEDESGTGILFQLAHQPEEAVFPAKEILHVGDVLVIKEPFFEATTTANYSLRVEHPCDVVRLDGDLEDRIPEKWKKQPTRSSVDIRNQGNEAVKDERWAVAHRL